MKNRLLIVDGHNLLFQMFFGMPSRIVDRNGKAIHGTIGFIGALLKIIRMTEPTHVAVLFDGEHKNPRSELDADYKSDRPDYSGMPEEESPFSQLPDIYAALDFMKIVHAEITDFETDDAIAAYVFSRPADTGIVISSFDSDFFQLIGDSVCVLRYRGAHSVICDTAYIRDQFGIEPSQYADWKCLVGDTADHIAGIPKIGPKTATRLLERFGDLKGIYDGVAEITPISVRDSLLQNRERAELNRKLIRLENRAVLPFPMDALSYGGCAFTTMEILHAIGS